MWWLILVFLAIIVIVIVAVILYRKYRQPTYVPDLSPQDEEGRRNQN